MRTALLPVAALLAGAFVLLTGNGLQGVLVPVRASLEQFATASIGMLSTAYAGGFIFSCYLTPHLVRRVGHIRTFAALAALAAATILTMSLLVGPVAWIVLRLASGFCLAGLFMVIESWLNEKSSNENRGQIFSVYMIVNLAAVTLGQMLLPVADPGGGELFVLTGVAIVLALVPVSLSTAVVPSPPGRVQLRLARLYRMSPVGIVGCLFVGLANGAYGGLGAVFARDLGFSLFEVALFMSASLVGGALAQMPVGRLSDRYDRRLVIVAVCIGAVGAGAALALFGGRAEGSVSPMLLIGLSGLFGCFIYVQYALCVAHTNDFIPAEDFVEASSGLLLTFGVGATVGPTLAALLMQRVHNGALFLFTATIHLLFFAFTLYRMTRRSAPPEAHRDDFVQINSLRATPVSAELDPRAGGHDDARAARPAGRPPQPVH